MYTSFCWVSPPDIQFVLQSFKLNHISLWVFIPSLHFSSLNCGKIWWCVFQEHTCFALTHFCGKGNTEQIVSAPATTQLQLTQQDRSILLLWFAIHQQTPPELLGTFAAFSQSSAVSFSAFCHISSSKGALIFVFSRRKRHICRDEVERGRCAGLVARCTLTYWAFPARISMFCGTFLSWGWLGGQAEVRRAERAGALRGSSLGSQELLIPAVPTKYSTCGGLNPTRVTNRAVDVQTHSSLCCFQLK